ncbi:oxidoreductase C-terminal domain-containing protein [Kitasatospora aureofaciens]|uniref:oxidoreductase C-terminal domain-containing protein n=1 Tax=Kitasatospora aureofaciens TaxID=1894 RepID=UPI000D135E8E
MQQPGSPPATQLPDPRARPQHTRPRTALGPSRSLASARAHCHRAPSAVPAAAAPRPVQPRARPGRARIQAYGVFPPDADPRVISGDPSNGRFTAACGHQRVVVGVLGRNAPRELRTLRRLVVERAPWSAVTPAGPCPPPTVDRWWESTRPRTCEVYA